MKLQALFLATIVLTGCGTLYPRGAGQAAQGPLVTAGLWSRPPAVKAGKLNGRIQLDALDSAFIKDPSFVDGGRPVEGTRYVAFGDLRAFYLKAFDVAARGGALSFRKGERRLAIQGLPARLDSVWAPQLRVNRDRLELFYCAGEMPPPEGPRWNTFRLRRASMPLAGLASATPTFEDQGEILGDLSPFGANDRDFGVIDPHLFVNRKGRAYMTYTVVRGGNGQRAHEEFVRYRRVDPADPARALGPDQPMYDGLSRGEDDGVAEAQDIATLRGHTYAFISSRPGDIDQRLLVAPIGDDLGRLARPPLQEFMYGGAEPWKARAVGSSSAVEIDGAAYMVYQGLDAERRFTLGWTSLQIGD